MSWQIKELREKVIERINLIEEINDDEIYNIIDDVIAEFSKVQILSVEKKCSLRKEIFDSIRGMDILEELISDENITEIMINGHEDIFIERFGTIMRANVKFSSKNRLMDVIQQMVSGVNRRVNEANPIVDSRLEDGSRVNVVLSPIAINGPVVTIRKFPKEGITIEKLIKIGSVTVEVAEFLRALVIAGYNIFISGGTGSGKTTFLNVLSNYIPKDERVITIEDSAELQLQEIDNLVRLEARQANAEGGNGITIRDLIKSSLRMRPDRIVVGEVRGAEALDMLQAMNTGHDGSLSTGHANSPKDMLSRLETMVLMGTDMPLSAIRSQIASGIDIIVHLGRLRDKSRKVLEIVEVLSYENMEIKTSTLYKFEECDNSETTNISNIVNFPKENDNKVEGRLIRTDNGLINIQKLLCAGFYEEAKLYGQSDLL